MAKKFSDLMNATMSQQAILRAKERTSQMRAEMPLHELRQARGLSQKALAEVLHVEQPAIAKMERRADMHVSTLRAHIRAMGGELQMVAKFPEGDVRIENFTELNIRK